MCNMILFYFILFFDLILIKNNDQENHVRIYTDYYH